MRLLPEYLPDKPAIITDGGLAYSYTDLDRSSKLIASHCHSGRLLFCLCRNSYATVAGYVGFLERGIPTLLLNSYMDSALLLNLIHIYRPRYIWSPSELVDALLEGISVFSFEGYTLLELQGTDYPIHPDIALLLTTSGSTGSPKLVKLTAGNILSNARSIADYLQIRADERPITTLPFYYSFGMSVVNSHLIKGATILLTEAPIMQTAFWTLFREQEATSLAGVPYTYEMLMRLRFSRMNLPSLKTMIQAGGRLQPDLVRDYVLDAQAKGRKFIVMYGQTEASPRMSWLPFEKALEKPSSIGIAIPGGRLSVRDMDGYEIHVPGKEGELVYEGPNVCLGYAERPEDLAKGDENHGVLHTGDLALFDEDGFFYITGRMKRFVKVWGNRCNLDALEQLVKRIASSCACVGVDDKITVFVTKEGLDEAIIENLCASTGFFPSAFNVRVLDEIPKKDTGKTDYPVLEQLLHQS